MPEKRFRNYRDQLAQNNPTTTPQLPRNKFYKRMGSLTQKNPNPSSFLPKAQPTKRPTMKCRPKKERAHTHRVASHFDSYFSKGVGEKTTN